MALMNKEEYIIKINDNEISVSKELYNTLVPLGKIINKLQQENKQLKEKINKVKNYLDNLLTVYEKQYKEKTLNYYNISYDLESLLEGIKELEGENNEKED